MCRTTYYLSILVSCLWLSFLVLSELEAQTCSVSEQVITVDLKESTIRTPPTGELIIPVVVHVVWKDIADNISDEQIFSQIDALNRDFNQLNDQSALSADFKPLAANINMKFCLARQDPKGNFTSGITRTRTNYDNIWSQMGATLADPIPRRRIYRNILEGHDSWDPTRYLNIWVGKLGNGKAGYGTFPGVLKAEDSDGIVVDPNFFGTVGTAANNSNFNQGRTAVHEIGHYLNLYHPWGQGASNFDCKADDLVEDTPRQEEAVYGCPSAFIFQCGNKVMSMNFMNFVSDNCMSLFTKGQKIRMVDALMSYRADLLRSNACQAVDSRDISEEFMCKVYPNPTEDNLYVTFLSAAKRTYSISDLTGRILQTGHLDSENNSLNVSTFAAGFYQLGINIGKQHHVVRFVKTP
ncbi:MAG: zinc-dependent metalloprotease [Saprospiraceae bacterium]